MIKRIKNIKNFGCIQDFEWDEKSIQDFDKINLIFGYNGSGKTTLSNLLYLFSEKSNDKTEIASEYIKGDTKFQIDYSTKAYSESNYNTFDGVLYAFNSKFINDHIFDGTKSKMSSFGLDSKITNESIDKIDEKLKNLILRKNYFQKVENDINNKLNGIWDKYKNDFNKRISGKRLTDKPQTTDFNNEDINTNSQKLQSFHDDYAKLENIIKANEVLDSIEGNKNNLTLFGLDFDDLHQHLHKPVNKDATSTIKRKIENINKVSLDSANSINPQEWFMYGNTLLKSGITKTTICPLCNTDIEQTISDLIKEYDQYFNDELKTLLDSMSHYEPEVRLLTVSLDTNKNIISSIILGLKHFNYSLQNEIKSDLSNIFQYQNEMIDQITYKRNHPNEEVIPSSKLKDEFVSINKQLKLLREELDGFILTQRAELQKLSSRDIVSEIKSQIKKVAIIEFNLKENCVITNSLKANSEICKKLFVLKKTNNKSIDTLALERESEVAKLQLETKFVNMYLGYLGISDFAVNRSKEKEIDNIIISYKSGTHKRSLKYSLSEGEKTALAFAFFLSKIRAEQLEGQGDNFKNIIIVIDDPISSLDENRLFQTANLIDTFFHYNEYANNEIPMQSFILSHNITFLKYICNIYYANHRIQDNIQEYFIEPTKHILTRVPNGLKNFTSTYLEKLDEIILYIESDSPVTYDIAKKYIPNYIRIVLESFLSFKLALVKEDAKGRIPGLNFLIGKALKELATFDESIEIGGIKRKGVETRLNNLKRIADNESHGSLAKIESLSYISESELKTYCKQMVQVMVYFDKIHYSKAKSLIDRK